MIKIYICKHLHCYGMPRTEVFIIKRRCVVLCFLVEVGQGIINATAVSESAGHSGCINSHGLEKVSHSGVVRYCSREQNIPTRVSAIAILSYGLISHMICHTLDDGFGLCFRKPEIENNRKQELNFSRWQSTKSYKT